MRRFVGYIHGYVDCRDLKPHTKKDIEQSQRKAKNGTEPNMEEHRNCESENGRESPLDTELGIGWMIVNGLPAQPIIDFVESRGSGPWDLHQPNCGEVPSCLTWLLDPALGVDIEPPLQFGVFDGLRLRKPQLTFLGFNVGDGFRFFFPSACSHGQSDWGYLPVNHSEFTCCLAKHSAWVNDYCQICWP